MRRLPMLALLALGGCKARTLPDVPEAAHHVSPVLAETGAASSTPSAVPAPSAPPLQTCAPFPEGAFALPPLDESVIDTKLPAIEFPDRLAHFYARAAEVARGTAKHSVRIAVYGDSNMTMDYITGGLRRMLQGKYGDAGHGFAGMTRPWGWYRHMDVRHELWEGAWKPLAVSTHRTNDGHYSSANLGSETDHPGAWAFVATTDSPDSPIGHSVSSIDLFYLARPSGGTFAVKLDGTVQETVDTKADKAETRFRHYDVPDGSHKIEVALRSGKIRVYGASMERDKPGYVVDSLGVGALNYEMMTHVSSASRKPMLERRNYDLVVFAIGTNMFSPKDHESWMKDVFAGIREALPDTPLLVLSPPDIELKWEDKWSDPRIPKLVQQLREISDRNGAAYFDFREAMGGSLSMHKLAKAGLAEADLIHFRKPAGMLMGTRLGHALWNDLEAYTKAHPDAGCSPRAAARPVAH